MKSIQRNDLANIIIFFAIILGAFMRFSPTVLAGFAINDGGMFAVMVDDLKISHYSLPVFTSYNGSNLPYAYPPFGFYMGRLASDLFNLSAPELMRWLPAFFASLSVPAFYLLASRLLKSRLHAALATLIFAFMPRAFSWFVMGGGLTRSPGQLFMLMTLASLVRLYKQNRRVDIIWTGLFGALAVLSHPEVAVHTAVAALLLWVMVARNCISFRNSVLVAAAVLLLSSPWWLTVIMRHGLAPLISASQTGQNFLAVFHLAFFAFSEEMYATPIAILGLLGFGLYLARREYLLPLWLVIPFLAEGRSATAAAAVPLALLAASAFMDIVLPGLRAASGRHEPPEQLTSVEGSALIYLFTYLAFSCYLFGSQISTTSLPASDRVAMGWVSQNTPATARFLVLSGSASVPCDPVSEWFPTLAKRKSLFTVQGTEWTLGEDFGSFVQKAGAVQACVSDGPACVTNLTKPAQYDYIYLSKTLRTDNCKPLRTPLSFPFFTETLRNDPAFGVVYETTGAIIYRAH